MTHIPGPWTVLDGVVVTSEERTGAYWEVATIEKDCGYPHDHAEANALLIAAAPELLEALEWYAAALFDVNRRGPEGDKARASLAWDAGRRAQVALSKAKQ